MRELLNGVYDLHIHTAPDVVPRKCSDLELARRLVDRGMAGCAIKCHYFDTAARAGLLMEQFPQLDVAGGVTLNRSVGGVNPDAVERSAQAGGRMVWFPTLEARAYQRYQHRNDPEADLSRSLTVCDEEGELLPQALEVLDAAARHHMVVGTGHVGAEEGMALVRAAAERSCTIVLTHADNPADCYSLEQQEEAAALGAYVEHCFFTTFHGRTPIGEIARQIRAVGCDRVLLTTDFGQLNSLYSDEGMEEYARQLLAEGFSREELETMMCRTPRHLLHPEEQD